MAESQPLREPWLIAAWPGMGNVAVAAAAHLVGKLGATLVHELPSRDLFDLNHVEVRNGVARPGRLPRNMFFECRNTNWSRDLLIFIGEGQPNAGGFKFCHQIMEYAQSRGAVRVVTFAAMATQLHPTGTPRVFGVTTDRELLDELQRHEVQLLREGQISGLNGVLLAAASERGVPALCLLGELPFFAVSVQNPKASLVVLESFSAMANIEIDLAELTQQSKDVEQLLVQLMEKMQEAAQQSEDEEPESEFASSFEPPGATSEDDESSAPKLNALAKHRIENLFKQAAEDRGKAFELKRELDRLGVFAQYEDRFLDLFKKAD